VIEHLPSKCKALNLIPSTAKTKAKPKKHQGNKVLKVRNDRGAITTNLTKTKRIIRESMPIH
jgi:uncharacterized protein (UPF0218 family)